MSSFDLDKLVLALAAELKRRDMRAHLDELRPYYRDLRARRLAAMREKQPPWTEEMVFEWLCILQVPPFENVLPLFARGVQPCSCLTRDVGLPHVACVFPGGRVRECKGCEVRWLEREES